MKLLRIAIFTIFGLSTSLSFAGISDCKNPVEIMINATIEGASIKFCEIPDAVDVVIGGVTGLENALPIKPRNFSSFQIGQFEVTQAQYSALMNDRPWDDFEPQLKPGVTLENWSFMPATYISHDDAVNFARLMSLIDRNATYRLPTEAEWEYAARAGTTTKYYWGENPSTDYSVFVKWGSPYADEKHPLPVMSCPNANMSMKDPGYCANNFGLMHMSGNIMEWTTDSYVDNYENAPTDGNQSVEKYNRSLRVLRGGHYTSSAGQIMSASRLAEMPNRGVVGPNTGFRLVRTPN